MKVFIIAVIMFLGSEIAVAIPTAIGRNSNSYPEGLVKQNLQINNNGYKIWKISFDFDWDGCSYHISVSYDTRTGKAAGFVGKDCGGQIKIKRFTAKNLSVSIANCDDCESNGGDVEINPNLDINSFSNWTDEDGNPTEPETDCNILEKIVEGTTNTAPAEISE